MGQAVFRCWSFLSTTLPRRSIIFVFCSLKSQLEKVTNITLSIDRLSTFQPTWHYLIVFKISLVIPLLCDYKLSLLGHTLCHDRLLTSKIVVLRTTVLLTSCRAMLMDRERMVYSNSFVGVFFHVLSVLSGLLCLPNKSVASLRKSLTYFVLNGTLFVLKVSSYESCFLVWFAQKFFQQPVKAATQDDKSFLSHLN